MVKDKKYIKIYFIFLFALFLSIIIPGNTFSESCKYSPRKTDQYIFYWGRAKIEGIGDVKIGDVIRAYAKSVEINGGCIGMSEVKTPGFYSAMAIYGDDITTEKKDGAGEGDTIYFTICHDGKEYLCKEGFIWISHNLNDMKEQNLTGISFEEYGDSNVSSP